MKTHEPHCPVPRMAAIGEGAVCLCRDTPHVARAKELAARIIAITGRHGWKTELTHDAMDGLLDDVMELAHHVHPALKEASR